MWTPLDCQFALSMQYAGQVLISKLFSVAKIKTTAILSGLTSFLCVLFSVAEEA